MEEETQFEYDVCDTCEKKVLEQDIMPCFVCTSMLCYDCSLEVYIWRCNEEDSEHSCIQCKVKLICKNHPEYKTT
jgi:hypothetical protein